MNVRSKLLDADLVRRQAMINGDLDTLDTVLADDLTWTHSSGVTESKTEFLNAISHRAVVYESLEIEQDQIREAGPVLVHSGVLRGSASRNGEAKLLHAKFLAVWRAEASPRLLAWQSTNIVS